MNRLVFLNRFFFPDHSATSQILSDLAFHLAGSGADVHVVTSQQLYDKPCADLAKTQIVNGVHVHRVATTAFGRSALIGRGIDYGSYYLSMWRSARSLVDRDDIIIAKTDPPLTSLVAMKVAAAGNARLVNWLQDIYPETAAELGVPLMRGPLGQWLCRARDISLHTAAANVVVGTQMAHRLRSRGVSADRVHVIPNWSNDVELRPVDHDNNPLRREWGLNDKFVAGYSGNLGRAHEFETVLSAAELLQDHPHIVFLFIGGGYGFERLAGEVASRGLQRIFRFIPYQDQRSLKHSLNVPDVHLISLRPLLEGLIVPSKFYGIAAVGRALISITAVDGEIARLVRQHDCGLVIAPGDGRMLAESLKTLLASPERMAQMGKNARTMLEREFTRAQALSRWERVLAELRKPAENVAEAPVPPDRDA